MNRFKELKIWQASMDLTVDVYKVTKSFPKEETYGLTSQIRRCVVSIASNIAEGSNRNGDKEFLNFLSIASGSAAELETQLLLSGKLEYLNNSTCEELIQQIDHIQNMNYKLQETIRQRLSK